MDFVDSLGSQETVYLLTDNPNTQKLFLDKYGRQKILVYNEILPVDKQKPVILSNDPNKIMNGQGSVNINEYINSAMRYLCSFHVLIAKKSIDTVI